MSWVDFSNSECACAALRRASRATTQFYDMVLRPSGLKSTQFILLSRIREAGEIAQWKLAREQTVAVETLSRRFAALRRNGMLAVRSGKHGEQIYRLTEAGEHALEVAFPYWERAQQRLKRTLSPSQFDQMLQLCNEVVEAARKAGELRAVNSPTVHDDVAPLPVPTAA